MRECVVSGWILEEDGNGGRSSRLQYRYWYCKSISLADKCMKGYWRKARQS